MFAVEIDELFSFVSDLLICFEMISDFKSFDVLVFFFYFFCDVFTFASYAADVFD